MNHYEFLGILNGTFADTEVGSLVSQIEETIKKHAETIHYTQNLGRRKLAYPIKHQGHGTYVLIEFDAPGEAIKKLDRLFRLTNELLRHCIVRRKTIGKPLPLERREEDARPRSFERGGGMRRALGEELLGDAPVLSKDSETTEPAEQQQEKTVAAVPEPEMPATMKTEDDLAPKDVASVPTDDSTQVSPVTSAEPNEESPSSSEEEAAKKKNKKVSYEELDKKLNELLSDDII